MYTSSPITLRAIRLLAVTIALVVATTGGFTVSQASAEVLNPTVSTGGSGGSGVAADTSDTTANAATASYEDVLAGSGYIWPLAEAATDRALTRNERAIQLIEGTFAAGGVLAGGEDTGDAEVARAPLTQEQVLAGSGYDVAPAEVTGSGDDAGAPRADTPHVTTF